MRGGGAEGRELRLLPRFVAAQLRGEQARDLRSLRERGALIEEKRARAAGEHVFDGAGAFVTREVNDLLRADRDVVFMENRTVNREVARDARALVEMREDGGVIDGILRHLAIRRPFSTDDREQARRRNPNRVVA